MEKQTWPFLVVLSLCWVVMHKLITSAVDEDPDPNAIACPTSECLSVGLASSVIAMHKHRS